MTDVINIKQYYQTLDYDLKSTSTWNQENKPVYSKVALNSVLKIDVIEKQIKNWQNITESNHKLVLQKSALSNMKQWDEHKGQGSLVLVSALLL